MYFADSIGSLGSRLAARFASFDAIAAFRSAAETRVSPGSPQIAISRLDSLPGRSVPRCVSALAEGVEFPVQRDADSLRLKAPGFIIVRPFLNGIKCIRTVSPGNVDGYENGFGSPSTTVALAMKVSEGVFGSDTAWLGPGAAVSIPTSGWTGQDCHGATTAAGITTVSPRARSAG